MTPVSANAGEYKSRIGLDSLYIAEVTQDDANGYVADTPEYLAPAAEASQEPNVSTETQYMDDMAFDVMTSEGETVVNLSISNLPPEMLAKVTGQTFDAASGRVFDTGGGKVAPFCALLFRSKKSNGKYRYYSYLKGKFEMPPEEAASDSNAPAPKPIKLVYRAIKTVYKFDHGSADYETKRVLGDEDTTNFSGTGWFSQVQTPTVVAPSALALSSSSPADNATGVAITVSPTLTYNNALQNAAIYGVSIIAASAGTVIAAAVTLDATKKIVTVNPNSNLSNSTEYYIVANVTDIYGQTLSSVVSFTTVAP